jgi:cytoskeletal protein CcmA (bactofilin family)
MAEDETTPPSESLENPGDSELETSVDALDKPDDGVIDATGGAANLVPQQKGFKQKLRQFNLYLLLFIFIIIVGLGILAVAYFQSKKATTSSVIKTQTLTQNALQQVASSDATVGNTGVVLNVQSSAVFAGKVLIRDGLEVAGNLQIGGTVSLSNITVSGTSQLGQLQVNKDLSVAGNTAIQGAVSIAKSLQVNGTGTFSGPLSAPQITTSSLQLNSDLVLTHHIVAGGATPTAARGSALGNGGSSSNSGSDTTGTVSINIGSGAAPGCFVTINFATKYNSTPHVMITPVGADGGAIDYYITRSTSGFSICDSTPAPAGAAFAFDYFVIN